MARSAPSFTPRQLLVPSLGLVACIFLWPAMVTFDPGDWPSPHQFPSNDPYQNLCGPVGAWMAYVAHYYLGDGLYPLLLFATFAAVIKLVRGEVGDVYERTLGLVFFVLCTSASTHLVSTPGGAGLPSGHGGVIGFALGEYLKANLAPFGTWIILTSCLIVGLIFVTDGWVLKLPVAVQRVGGASGGAVAAIRGIAAAIPRVRPLPDCGDDGPAVVKVRPKKRRAEEEVQEEEEEFEDDSVEAFDEADDEEEQDEEAEENSKIIKTAVAKRLFGSRRRKLKGPKVNLPSKQKASAAEPYPRQIENWTLPDLSLLHEPEYGFTEQQEQFVREQAKTLEHTLEEFGLDAHVVEIDTGPVITMFEIRLGKGIKVSQVASLSNDIARALKAHAIRVVAPIPGKNTVGIEVPNIKKERVRMAELMSLAGKKASSMKLPLFLGKDASGAALVADLTKMPHVLIAGTTGSGKSVCINSMILSLLMTQRPDHVKMILVDPKMVELSQFKEVPHLMCPIVTDVTRAEKILEWAVTKMDERYEQLAEAQVKNIGEYNALGEEKLFDRLGPVSEEEKARIVTHLPYVVIIIDELADLMMTAAKEVEHHLSRLAQKSRAVGIHMIVATQRPEAKVVTGLIKSNLPSRICFRVASRMDSRIVLDQNGGEVLMGQGDMLFLPPGSHKLTRAQGTFLEDDEVQAVLDDLADRAKPEFHPELVKIRSADDQGGDLMRDPLFDKAVRVVLESKRGSVSLLQRRLMVGYSRASRLIDQIAEAGIVGEYKGSQAREVVMSLKEWDALKKQVDEEVEDGYEADEEAEYEDPTEGEAEAAEEEEEEGDEVYEYEAEAEKEEDEEPAYES